MGKSYSRFRNSGGFDPLTYDMEQVDCQGALTVASGTLLEHANGTYRSMQDVVIPDFKKRVARGEVIVNPMDQVSITRMTVGTTAKYASPCDPVDQTLAHTNGYRILHHNYLGQLYHAPASTDVGSLKILAGTQALAGIASPEFEGMVFLAELRETMRMLRHPVAGYVAFLEKIKKIARGTRGIGSDGRAYKILKDFIAGQWLHYRYGIMPLVHDAEALVKAIEALGHEEKRKTSRGFATDVDERNLMLSGTAGHWDVTKKVNTNQQTAVRAGILYSVDKSASFGMRLQDVPAAAWEAIPFSFVSDWFLNLGDWVRAITPKAGVKVLGSWTTVETETISSGTGSSEFNPPQGSQSYSIEDPTSYEVLVTTRKIRTPGVELGVAFEPLPFAGDFGAKRILDLSALARQLLKSKLR